MNPEKEYELVVWDLETSGFNAPKDKVLEIGMRVYEKLEDLQTPSTEDGFEKSWMLQNNILIPDEIVKITGITEELIKVEGKDPKECIKEFLHYLKRAKRHVTHNGLAFDIPFLVNYVADLYQFPEEEKQKMLETLRKTAFDTAIHFKGKKVGVEIRKGEPFTDFADRVNQMNSRGIKYNLGLCCDEEKIDRSQIIQHRALADVFLTTKLYQIITLPQLFETPYQTPELAI